MLFRRILQGAALSAALSLMLAAQQPNSGYHSIACVKVKPGKAAEFNSFIQGDVHKLEQQRVDSGALYGWAVLRAIYPQGTDAMCDYSVVTFFRALPMQSLGGDELTAALHKAGVSMSAQEFTENRDALGYLVYSELVRTEALVGGGSKGGYIVFNSMTVPNIAEWLAFEKKMWQPFAEEMLKDGVRSGWALNVPIFPGGGKDQNLASTVDMYPTWESIFQSQSAMAGSWKKAHPDIEPGPVLQQAAKLRTIDHRVVYKVDDFIMASK